MTVQFRLAFIGFLFPAFISHMDSGPPVVFGNPARFEAKLVSEEGNTTSSFSCDEDIHLLIDWRELPDGEHKIKVYWVDPGEVWEANHDTFKAKKNQKFRSYY